MIVRDLLELFTEDYQLIELWSFEQEKVVMRATVSDILDSEYADYEVNTIDSISKATTIITLNID